ncbi:MAG: WYL domain-containing protein [Eubacteriales bacterium]|nr:WYL domain-containing protein [Eubacteriales bacterium]
MAKSNNQKAKILYLEQLLCQTGEDNTITMQQILSILEEHNIRAERKSIYDDFDVLRSFGMDIRYRRGKNGGYFLAGGASNTDSKIQSDFSEKDSVDQPVKKAVVETENGSVEWKNTAESSGKQMKLLVSGNKKEEVQKFFGTHVQFKDMDDEQVLAVVPAVDTAQFFGWLTFMGKTVRIMKPKKIAQSYREYLKVLAKEYKGI